MLPFRRLQLLFGALVIVVYAAVSFRVGAVFPFYDFPMFSQVSESRGRTLARTPGGRLEAIDAYDRWHCPDLEQALLMRAPCGLPQTWFHDELAGAGNVVVYLRSHSSSLADGEPVEVVLRAWTAPDGKVEQAPTDCPIMRCRAHRRAGASKR